MFAVLVLLEVLMTPPLLKVIAVPALHKVLMGMVPLKVFVALALNEVLAETAAQDLPARRHSRCSLGWCRSKCLRYHHCSRCSQ